MSGTSKERDRRGMHQTKASRPGGGDAYAIMQGWPQKEAGSADTMGTLRRESVLCGKGKPPHERSQGHIFNHQGRFGRVKGKERPSRQSEKDT